VHSSPASSRLNSRPRLFKWASPFRRKTKSGFWACAITFKTQPTPHSSIQRSGTPLSFPCLAIPPGYVRPNNIIYEVRHDSPQRRRVCHLRECVRTRSFYSAARWIMRHSPFARYTPKLKQKSYIVFSYGLPLPPRVCKIQIKENGYVLPRH